jgi:hypothetical protein
MAKTIDVLKEFVDYYKEWEYVINDELRLMLYKAEAVIKKEEDEK